MYVSVPIYKQKLYIPEIELFLGIQYTHDFVEQEKCAEMFQIIIINRFLFHSSLT